jgi:hypothetical protein
LSPSLDEILAKSDILVIGNRLPAITHLLDQTKGDHIIIDLVRIREALDGINGNYQGICW